MSTPVLITPEMIDSAERAGACPPAVDWLRKAPRTVDDLVCYAPGFATWALRYPGFTELLTDGQFAKIVKRCPYFALRDATNRLSDEQFAFCVDAEPVLALTQTAPRDRLTGAVFDDVVRRHPDAALIFALRRLSPEQIDECARREPRVALDYAEDILSHEQLMYCLDHA